MRYRYLFLLFLMIGLPAQACEKLVSLADADWRVQQGDNLQWAQPGFDDSHWTRITHPEQPADTHAPGTRDGYLWYRLRFHLSPADLQSPCHLLLGVVQETDEVFLNGWYVGGEGKLGKGWYGFVSAMRKPRAYALPSSALVAGENLVAVRAFSLYLGTGLSTENVRIGPTAEILHEANRKQNNTGKLESVTLTLLILGALVTGFLSLTRQSERQHRMLFGFILAVTIIYLVDSLLFYPVRLEAAWTKRLVFPAGGLIPVMLLRYLSMVSGERFSRVIWILACVPLAIAIPMLLEHPLDRITRLYDVWFLSFVPVVFVFMAFMLRRARFRMQQSRLILLAGIVVAVGLLYALVGQGDMPANLNPVEFGILGMAVLLMVAFARRLTREYEARLRLSAGVLSAQDEERRRIARELHDGLGQRLVAARLLLEAEALQRPGSGQLQEVVRELRDTTRELRAIVHGLRPVELGEVSFRSALQSYSQRVRELTGVHVQVEHHHSGFVPSETEEHLFRIVQEGVNNAIRHGGAHEVRIDLGGDPLLLKAVIRDDGAGFKLEAGNRQGLGLTAMAERVRLCRGQFHVESRLGEGTTLRIEIPLS